LIYEGQYERLKSFTVDYIKENPKFVNEISVALHFQFKELSSIEEIFNYLIKLGYIKIKYTHWQFGIPITDFLKGYSKFNNILSIIKTRYTGEPYLFLGDIVTRIGTRISISNEGSCTLWKCEISPDREFKK